MAVANLCSRRNRHLRTQGRCRSTRTARRRYWRVRTRDRQSSMAMESCTLLFLLAGQNTGSPVINGNGILHTPYIYVAGVKFHMLAWFQSCYGWNSRGGGQRVSTCLCRVGVTIWGKAEAGSQIWSILYTMSRRPWPGQWVPMQIVCAP
jgi:hypothetical protein